MASIRDIFNEKIEPIFFSDKKEEAKFWAMQTKHLKSLRKKFKDITLLDKRVPKVKNLIFLFSEQNIALLTMIEKGHDFQPVKDVQETLGEDIGRDVARKSSKKILIYG